MINNNQFKSLDTINILSFIAQLKNIEDDSKEREYIHAIILIIATEIQKLHKENNKLEQKLDEILLLLKNRRNK